MVKHFSTMATLVVIIEGASKVSIIIDILVEAIIFADFEVTIDFMFSNLITITTIYLYFRNLINFIRTNKNFNFRLAIIFELMFVELSMLVTIFRIIGVLIMVSNVLMAMAVNIICQLGFIMALLFMIISYYQSESVVYLIYYWLKHFTIRFKESIQYLKQADLLKLVAQVIILLFRGVILLGFINYITPIIQFLPLTSFFTKIVYSN